MRVFGISPIAMLEIGGPPSRGFAGFLKISRKLPSSNVGIVAPYGHNEYMTDTRNPIDNTHDVPNGRINVYFSNDEGRYTTFCDHGATPSGASYIGVHAHGGTSIHWGKGIYNYTGGDALAIVATFAGTLSMGKTANFIKATSTLVSMTPFDADGELDFDNRVTYPVAA